MNRDDLKKWIKANLFNKQGKINNRRITNNSKFYQENSKIFDIIHSIIKQDIKLLEKLYLLMNDLDKPSTCKICSKPVKFFNYTMGYQTYCSIQCQHKDDDIKAKCKETKLKKYGNPNYNNKEKYRKTMIEKYGVDHNFKSKDIREKIKETKKSKYNDPNFNNRDKAKETIKSKYGVENVSQIEKVKNKKRDIFIKLYSVDNPMKLKIFQQKAIKSKIKKYGSPNNFKKMKETNINKYGVISPFGNKEIQNKIKKTNIDKYGVDNPLKVDEIKEQIKQTIFLKFGVDHINQKNIKNYNEWIDDNRFIKIYNKYDNIEDIYNYFNVSHFPIYKRARKLNLLYKPNRRDITIKNIGNIIESFGYNIEYNNRTIIKPLELDIVIRKDNKIVKALEYNGLMFHSLGISEHKVFNNWDKYRDNISVFINKDRIKLDKCRKLNIELLILREDIYLNNPNIIGMWLNGKLKYRILDKPVIYRFKSVNKLEEISIDNIEYSIENGYRIYFDWLKFI